MRLRDIQMHAIVYSPNVSGGPGTAKIELDRSLLNCVWQANQSLPGLAAFSMSRYDPKLSQIDWMQDHIKLVREDGRATKTVFAGKLVKPEIGQSDVVVRCWDYFAFLQRSRTGFRTLYPSKKVGTEVVSPEWIAARAAVNSLFTFVTTGTIEDPLAADEATAIKTNSDFGVVDFNRLFVFYSMAEMAMANTSHNVVAEITRESPHTFNFWKNRSSVNTKYAFTFPGNLMAADYQPGYDQYRNDLATVLDDATGGSAEFIVETADVATTAYRRLQDAVSVRTLLGAIGTTEADQVKAIVQRELQKATRLPQIVSLQPRQGEVTPFDGWDLGDTFRTTIQKADRSGDELDAYLRVISVGAAWTPEHGELLQLYARGTP